MPDGDDEADKYELADALLGAGGLGWYEISNWAREPGARCLHNLAYWRGGDWWGVGPGAHSHVGGVRWWNVKHPRAYADRLEVLQQDALTVTELPGPEPTALVANLPYNVSVPVVLRFLERFPSIRTMLVMVQLEVAQRLAAGPGSKTYGVPSVKAAWFADVRRAGAVGRNVFWPAPNVDSGLVSWTRREPPVTSASREQVFAVVDAAFAQRRKTLRSVLRSLAPVDVVVAALDDAGIDPQTRGEQLAVTDFARLADALGRARTDSEAPEVTR